MDDAALKAAEAKLAEIRRLMSEQRNAINDAMSRLNTLEFEAAELDGWITMWHSLAGTARAPTAAKQSEIGLPVVKTPKPRRPKNPEREVVVDAALDIIRERGEPMSRRELFEALTASGIKLQGKNPEMVLSTMLWRSQDRIQRLVPFGYWPTGVKYPPKDDLDDEVEQAFDL